MTDEINYLEKYIKKISSNCKIPYGSVESVILTQLALILSDLAVKKSSNIFIGNIHQEDNYFKIELNDFMKKIIEGEIDPIYLLNELLKR